MSISFEKTIQKLIEQIDAVANYLPIVLIVHDIKTKQVLYMSPLGLRLLGTTLYDLQSMGEDYHSVYFNTEESKEYAPKIFGMLQRNIPDEIITFFQQVNLLSEEEWKWHISAVKVLLRDENKDPVLIITSATAIDPTDNISIKADKLLEDNIFLRKHINLFQQLTNSERHVLQFIAQGKTSAEIAEALHLSLHTINTHRRNIKSKVSINGITDLVAFARIFNSV